MTVNIKIVGTDKDVNLLKKIIRQYVKQTKSIVEKQECESYISLIQYAEEQAKCTRIM